MKTYIHIHQVFSSRPFDTQNPFDIAVHSGNHIACIIVVQQ